MPIRPNILASSLGGLALLAAACSPAAREQQPAPTSSAAVHERSAHGDDRARTRNTVQTVTLIRADGREIVLTAADLAALPQESVRFERHGEIRTYSGPLLLDVLARAGAATSPLHAPDLASVVLVDSADSYQVAFGLAETDPATRADRIILAYRADGAALSPEDGPFMVIAENDVRAARSTKMVTSLKLIYLASPPSP